MDGWHHRLSAPEFKQTPGDSEGQRSLGPSVYGVAKSWTSLRNQTTTISRLVTGKANTFKNST